MSSTPHEQRHASHPGRQHPYANRHRHARHSGRRARQHAAEPKRRCSTCKAIFRRAGLLGYLFYIGERGATNRR